MAVSSSLGVKCLGFIVITVMVVATQVESAITCSEVNKSLSPCLNYLKSGGSVSTECCNAVKTMNIQANTSPNLKSICNCLKSAYYSIKGINLNLAAGLPAKCNTKTSYPISLSVNCTILQ
ncbi:non-specific lipid-transfer protein 1-like [Humulus lupulus]|uniref:non-specific lipid-transfer protein 1-like n=1 Tax=Humulus lupulus TaxID=3486 RepID=UPI002B4110F8|nr:non-specific lipid-transfer protein 1-like [Humulus lupulus]